jgi:hypothetical protein
LRIALLLAMLVTHDPERTSRSDVAIMPH